MAAPAMSNLEWENLIEVNLLSAPLCPIAPWLLPTAASLPHAAVLSAFHTFFAALRPGSLGQRLAPMLAAESEHSASPSMLFAGRG